MKYFIPIALIFIILSCNTEKENKEPHPLDVPRKKQEIKLNEKVNLFNLSWMQGFWIDSTSLPGKKIVEKWSLIQDTLIGIRGTINNNDTTYAQTSKIFISNGNPTFLLEPEGSPFVVFKLKKYNQDSITFGNIANLAPTELTYYKKHKNNLGLSITIITPVGERIFNHSFIPLKF